MNSSCWRQEGDAVDEQSQVEAGGGRWWRWIVARGVPFLGMPHPSDEPDPDRLSRLGVDEQDPVEGWMNRSPWRAG